MCSKQLTEFYSRINKWTNLNVYLFIKEVSRMLAPVGVSLRIMDRDKEIVVWGKMLTHKFTIVYTGYPYRWTMICFGAKVFQGRQREGYIQEIQVFVTRGLSYMFFCSPACRSACRLVERMMAVKGTVSRDF
jgi:hypothetical protein